MTFYELIIYGFNRLKLGSACYYEHVIKYKHICDFENIKDD